MSAPKPTAGSPPRVRGTVSRRSRCWSIAQDHPRVCGEQERGSMLWNMLKGSPPRVRGTEISNISPLWQGRITPACAGNSESIQDHLRHPQDHPRVCGEQLFQYSSFHPFAGSPPRVRGTVKNKVYDTNTARITPACAGNSACTGMKTHVTEDHPRVCGEQM